TGLRWEEAVAVPIGHVNLIEQSIYIDRTASESGGRRDIREDLKTRAAERTVMIPDIAMPAVRRLAARREPGRERSNRTGYVRLINGDRGIPRLCHVAALSQIGPWLHCRPSGRDRWLHRARAAARLCLAADRLRRRRRPGRSPDGAQQDRDDQEHPR